MKPLELLKLKFLPASANLGLLVLRVWLGLSMLLIHGLDKLQHFGTYVANFGKMGFPAPLATAAILSESLFSVLLVLGVFTRVSAIFLAATMGVAFFKAHQMVLIAPHGTPTGELPFIYLAGFVTIFFAGGGRFAVDEKL